MAVVQNVRKVYVANISRHAREKDIGRLFEDAGRIASLEHKGNFGFIEYETDRAAEDAIRRFHDNDFMGKRLIVKPYRYRGGDFRYNPDAAPNPAKFRGPRSVSYRLYITGLDDSTSWQDVKDFARTGGKSVCYTDVYSRHNKKEGVIEYYKREDFEYALRYLDRARLNGCRVRVFDRQPGGDDDDGRNRSRSRGRGGRGRENHRDRDNGYDRDRDRDRNRGNRMHRDNGNYGDRDRQSYRGRDNGRGRDNRHDNDNHMKRSPRSRSPPPRRDMRDTRENNHMKRSPLRSRSPRSRSPPPRNKMTPPLSNDHNNDKHMNDMNNLKGRMNDKPRDSRSKSPPHYHNGRRQRSHSPIHHMKRSVSRSKSNH
eukprot:206932_1